jgi:acyl dehydratase
MKTLPDWNTLQVGDELPALDLPPLTRHTLALYCGASGDHNPIHVDIDFAKASGLPDVIAHGMLSAAWVARVLTDWVPQSAIRSLDVRFSAMTTVGERIRCTGRVSEKLDRAARVQLQTANSEGAVKLSAEAVIAWP